MMKFATLTAALLYATFCYETMPKKCFTLEHAALCQKVQIIATSQFRAPAWGTVHNVRSL